MDHSQRREIRVLWSRRTRQYVKDNNGRQIGGSSWMNGGRVALNVQPPVPNEVNLGLVRLQLHRAQDLDGCTVVHGGHFSAVHSGGGGEEVDVEWARE